VKYYLESLGCPKNLVDAQGIARLLKYMGHQPVSDPREAGLLIVNTCGFIEDAREESLGELLELAQLKRDDQLLVAAGCLSQRWGSALVERVPGVDGLLGTRRWTEIGSLLEGLEAAHSLRQRRPVALLDDPLLDDPSDTYRFARQGSSAYLKIADGCSAPCAFCAIPLIKGPAASRPPRAVVEDAIELVSEGAKEIILIAQDTTAYGRDRGERDALPDLMEAILAATPQLRWLRVMYAYPGHVSPRLIRLMASDPRVCHYLDLPLQHAHPEVLRRMRRPSNADDTRRLVADLRGAMPDLALRSSFIVGYPGETEAEFETLLGFVAEIRPERVGVFLYSPEAGTRAAGLRNSVPDKVKTERYDRLMEVQQQMSVEANQAQVGRTLDVLIEGLGDGLCVGRSYRDAPEIDGLVLFPGDAHRVPIGSMVPVQITGAMEYDLIGEVKLPQG
jgi:ribosomal protein S12 methylthiotransferase